MSSVGSRSDEKRSNVEDGSVLDTIETTDRGVPGLGSVDCDASGANACQCMDLEEGNPVPAMVAGVAVLT